MIFEVGVGRAPQAGRLNNWGCGMNPVVRAYFRRSASRSTSHHTGNTSDKRKSGNQPENTKSECGLVGRYQVLLGQLRQRREVKDKQ